MNQLTGQLLRLVGLAVEMVCLILWFTHRNDARRIGGIGVTDFLFAGVVLGFVVWLAGRVVIQVASARSSAGGSPDPPVDAPGRWL